MSGKKIEGDEQVKRQRAREARKRGRRASEEAATTGASKQRHHQPRDEEHAVKDRTHREGKQHLAPSRTKHGRKA